MALTMMAGLSSDLFLFWPLLPYLRVMLPSFLFLISASVTSLPSSGKEQLERDPGNKKNESGKSAPRPRILRNRYKVPRDKAQPEWARFNSAVQ
ncbi:hypothetical protein ACQKWADRAFT_288623 [Trichoderma austrokoningii]